MNTYENLKRIIILGRKNKEEILELMDVFLMNHRINTKQYEELISLLS
jgi:hypothetical protein